jgi:hypothetical protein
LSVVGRCFAPGTGPSGTKTSAAGLGDVTQGAGFMDTIAKGYRGLHLLWDLNWDRLLYLATITVALFAGGLLGKLLL